LALESNASLNDKVTTLTTDLAAQADIDDLNIRCCDLEKRDEGCLAKVRQFKEKLLEITQEQLQDIEVIKILP